MPNISDFEELDAVVMYRNHFSIDAQPYAPLSMPRQFIKRYTPDRKALRKHRSLRHLGTLLQDENLWHLNRRSVSGGVASGLFWAMIPFPTQMIASALVAVFFRINLPISVALVWTTNPITIPPVFYFNYLVGTWLLGTPSHVGKFELSIEWIAAEIGAIWQPLWAGSLLIGTLLGIIGYCTMRLYWRWHVLRRFQARRTGNRSQTDPSAPPSAP